MKDMQITTFLESLSTSGKAWSVLGFLGTFSFIRFFKKRDDLAKKVEKLDRCVTEILINQKHYTQDIESLKQDFVGALNKKMDRILKEITK